jgi:hypothetical protein
MHVATAPIVSNLGSYLMQLVCNNKIPRYVRFMPAF